jgi:hypothetical protein
MTSQGDQEREGKGGRRRGERRSAGGRADCPPGTGAQRGFGPHDPQPGTQRSWVGPHPEQPGPASSDGCRYMIRVQGHLDAQWSEWLDGMTITHEEGGQTRLEGPVVDQAALHGLLNKLRDLCLTILIVQRLGTGAERRKGGPEG